MKAGIRTDVFLRVKKQDFMGKYWKIVVKKSL